MSGSLNKVTLIGNLGKDPEIRATSDGREVANLVIATNESWVDKQSGDRREKTEWHRVACFNPGLVNIIKKHLKKGGKIYLEGQLQTRKWQDQAGQDRYSTEIVLQGYNCNLTMLDRIGGEEYGSAPRASNSPSDSHGHDDYSSNIDDEIPF